ncbi:MAG: hypothetical protein PHT49_04295 [Desulfovibrionales bacterium]|nr:hypothetical protein [Desulfovibrionales bacterium]
MAEIKSALEKAMERAEKIGRATEEELKENLYLDEGRRLAARYLRGEDMEFTKALEQKPAEARPYILKGMVETLLRNIVLPRDEDIEEGVKRAMQGMLTLKKNNSQARRIMAQIEEAFRQYKQTISDVRKQLRARFEMKMGNVQKQLEEQAHMKVKIDPEQLPQFQEEWLKISAEINAQFDAFLEQQKELLRTI